MSSWLSGLKNLTENVQLKDLTDKVQEVTSKVQAAIPISAETIQKLTLMTPELKAERQQMDQEYKHKVAVKDSLAHMFPWETRDEEREILVEECKEVIMGLSNNVDTFFGPYEVPRFKVDTTKKNEEKTEEEQLLEEVENEDKEEEQVLKKDMSPTEESLEKLKKLEPLPALLANFDLLAHVGLIKKMLAVDSKLVERQSTLSGGGDRENVFWRNYFFHCAYTRYEAGLSIDEIWSDESPQQQQPDTAVEDESTKEEETVTFDAAEQQQKAVSDEAAAEDDPSKAAAVSSTTQSDESGGSGSTSAEYEIVDGNTNDNSDEDVFAGEMDELEAEILKELED